MLWDIAMPCYAMLWYQVKPKHEFYMHMETKKYWDHFNFKVKHRHNPAFWLILPCTNYKDLLLFWRRLTSQKVHCEISHLLGDFTVLLFSVAGFICYLYLITCLAWLNKTGLVTVTKLNVARTHYFLTSQGLMLYCLFIILVMIQWTSWLCHSVWPRILDIPSQKCVQFDRHT